MFCFEIYTILVFILLSVAFYQPERFKIKILVSIPTHRLFSQLFLFFMQNLFQFLDTVYVLSTLKRAKLENSLKNVN